MTLVNYDENAVLPPRRGRRANRSRHYSDDVAWAAAAICPVEVQGGGKHMQAALHPCPSVKPRQRTQDWRRGAELLPDRPPSQPISSCLE
jgi:hypothetical protein